MSTPVTWDEVESGFEIDDFRMDNVPERVRKEGDLWKPLLATKGRFKLDEYLGATGQGKEHAMAKKTTSKKTTEAPEEKLAEYRRKRDFYSHGGAGGRQDAQGPASSIS